MKKILVLIITTLLIICGTVFAEEETNIPQLINYQGKLTDSDGNALSTKEYEMSFSVYSVQTGGTAVWGPQEFKDPNKITVVRGFFNIILGPVDSIDRKIEQAFESPNAYLEITVDGKVINPRQQVLSTSYAFQSQKSYYGVSPVGSVITWTMSIPPEGHLECNGQSLSTTEYPELFAVIKYTYGGSGDKFNIPDYRGYFLRSWSNDTTNDPDKDSRKDKSGNIVGNKIGSMQEGEVQKHQHLLNLQERRGASGGGDFTSSFSNGFGPEKISKENVGNETRPKNINVMYCIKYKKYNE
ncbi:MAG: tail fiber protein [Deltaproteobacteria bacterium]|nr:tail fiber protein [Deltaproteobacteria bacterium]